MLITSCGGIGSCRLRSISAQAVLLLGAAAMAGCAATPKVGYSKIETAGDLNDQQIATYALQENLVTFKAVTTGEGEKKKTTMTAETDRQDHAGLRLALLRRDSPGIQTGITIKKFENTDIPSEVTIEVKDTRLELIEKAGTLVVSVIKSGLFGFSGTEEAKLPMRINLTQLIGGLDPGEIEKVDNDLDIRVVYSSIPLDAVETKKHAFGNKTSYFYYAACRNATVEFKYGGERYSYTFKVSDPNFLQRARMPVDGKITMHSQCGASVTGKMAGEDASTSLAIVSALLAQGKSINDALKAEDEAEQ